LFNKTYITVYVPKIMKVGWQVKSSQVVFINIRTITSEQQ